MIVTSFVDDFGNLVYPYELPNYMGRYYFFRGEM